MRFDGYAQGWLGGMRLVLVEKCTVMLLVVVRIQAGRN